MNKEHGLDLFNQIPSVSELKIVSYAFRMELEASTYNVKNGVDMIKW